MPNAKINWGRLLDFPEFRAYQQIKANERDEYVKDLISRARTPNANQEKLVELATRIDEIDELLDGKFAQGD